MRLVFLFLAALCFSFSFSQNYTSYHTGTTNDLITNPLGGICIMGGASEHDEAMKWFLNQANGGDVIVLRTSGSDGYNNYMFSQLGVTLNSVETIVCHNVNASFDPQVIDQLSKAEAIWFAGGDQWEYISYWRNTPIDSIINLRISDGLVIGGTSAGMAIQGRLYFSAENGTITSSTALNNPFHFNMTVDTSLFIKNEYLFDVITDTHYDNPDRKGRHFSFLTKALVEYGIDAKGIACDEYTAVCIGTDGIAKVYGDYPNYDENAYFIQVNCEVPNNVPEVYQNGQNLTWDQAGAALTVYQVKGTPNGSYSFDLNNWKSGMGGTWQNWSVSNGVLSEISTSEPDCLSTNVENLKANVQLFPNPSSEYVQIRTEYNFKEIQITDITGKSTNNFKVSKNTGRIDLSNLPAGQYYLKMLIQGERIVLPLHVIH